MGVGFTRFARKSLFLGDLKQFLGDVMGPYDVLLAYFGSNAWPLRFRGVLSFRISGSLPFPDAVYAVRV